MTLGRGADGVTMWFGAGLDWVQLFSGDPLVELFVDGVSQGVINKSAPLRLPGLKPGNHTIQGVKQGYEPDGPREEMVYPGRDSRWHPTAAERLEQA